MFTFVYNEMTLSITNTTQMFTFKKNDFLLKISMDFPYNFKMIKTILRYLISYNVA